METTLTEIAQKKVALFEERVKRINNFNALESAYKSSMKILEENEKLIFSGLSVDKINKGKEVVYVRGSLGNLLTRKLILTKAKEDLATGCKSLKTAYFGVKNYASFGDQREDHSYGMGPSHGIIVFAIELKIRDRDLTTEEIEYALYYLSAFQQIEAVKKAVR